MRLDGMTAITNGSYTGGDLFCKSQLITCNRVKECNGVCPFEDALKHADKEMDEQNVIDHDRDWIIGCLQHDGFIHTHRFDKANQIILDALSAEAVEVVRCRDCMYYIDGGCESNDMWQSLYGESSEVESINRHSDDFCSYGVRREDGEA